MRNALAWAYDPDGNGLNVPEVGATCEAFSYIGARELRRLLREGILPRHLLRSAHNCVRHLHRRVPTRFTVVEEDCVGDELDGQEEAEATLVTLAPGTTTAAHHCPVLAACGGAWDDATIEVALVDTGTCLEGQCKHRGAAFMSPIPGRLTNPAVERALAYVNFDDEADQAAFNADEDAWSARNQAEVNALYARWGTGRTSRELTDEAAAVVAALSKPGEDDSDSQLEVGRSYSAAELDALVGPDTRADAELARLDTISATLHVLREMGWMPPLHDSSFDYLRDAVELLVKGHE